GRWIEWSLPAFSSIIGTDDIAAQKSGGSCIKIVGMLRSSRIRSEESPAVASTKQGAVPKLQQAGILRAAEGMGINQLWLMGPMFTIRRADLYQVAVGIDVTVAFLTQSLSVGSTSESHDVFAVRLFDD